MATGNVRDENILNHIEHVNVTKMQIKQSKI